MIIQATILSRKIQYLNWKIFDPILTIEDWNILVKVAEIKKYNAGDYIIKQGNDDLALYQLVKGSLSLTITNHEEEVSILKLVESDIFNEYSYYKGLPSIYNVKVESDTAEVFVFEEKGLNLIRVVNEDLLGKFFNFVCRRVAGVINRLEIS